MLKRRYALILLFLNLLILSGCDTLLIKRIDIEKNNESKNFLDQRSIIISVIDSFITENNLSCRPRDGLIRFCDQTPKTLVAFEGNDSFTVCLFMLGPAWEKNKFYNFSSRMEHALISKMPSVHIIGSLPNELPQCSIPSQ